MTKTETVKGKKTKGNNIRLIKQFLPFYKPYKKIVIFDLFCVLLATLVDLIFPYIIKTITNEAVISQGLVVKTTINFAILLFGLKTIEVFCKYFINKYGHIMGLKMECDLRENLFGKFLKLPNSFYDNAKIGTLMSRITTDLFDITEFSHHCPEELFIAIIKIVGIFIILMFSNVILTLAIFTMLPFMILFSIFYNKRWNENHLQNRVQIGEISAQVEDSLAGIRTVRSFANEDVESSKFKKSTQSFFKIRKKGFEYMATYNAGILAMNSVMYIIIILLGGILKLNPGTFVAYLLYATTLLTTVVKFADYTEQYQRGITAFSRYQDIMDTTLNIDDKIDAQELNLVSGKVTFNNVNFKYNKDERIILDSLNFEINRGEVIAIVGPSGGGKTTIANLIPRFYDVTNGEILIDNNNIKDVTLRSLRKNIGIVQQDVYIFWGTIADNIAYGKANSTREEILLAAKLAGIDDFVKQLPMGYDSYIGEKGIKLSGGQKQRLSIARVFLKNPPILILDEATSSLDNESELIVQKSLDSLSKGRTSIIIAHRLSTIRNATKIIVLTENGIAESGTHNELMANEGIYKRLYTLSSPNEFLQNI